MTMGAVDGFPVCRVGLGAFFCSCQIQIIRRFQSHPMLNPPPPPLSRMEGRTLGMLEEISWLRKMCSSVLSYRHVSEYRHDSDDHRL